MPDEPTVIANLRYNLAQPPPGEHGFISMERAGFQALLDAYDALASRLATAQSREAQNGELAAFYRRRLNETLDEHLPLIRVIRSAVAVIDRRREFDALMPGVTSEAYLAAERAYPDALDALATRVDACLPADLLAQLRSTRLGESDADRG